MALKKIALIDIDGCLSDYPNKIFFDLAKDCYDENVNTKTEILEKFGLSAYKFLKNKLRTEGYKFQYEFDYTALNTIDYLREKSFEIWIYTSRPNIGNNHSDTRNWLQRNNVVYDVLYFTGTKGESYLDTDEETFVLIVDDDDTAFLPYLNKSNVVAIKFGGESRFSTVRNAKSWIEVKSIVENLND